MTDNTIKYYGDIQKTADMLYRFFDGQKKTHSEILEKAELFLSITMPYAKSLPEYHDISDAVVEIFELEVGNKTYNPNILSKDKESTYWLYRAKPTTNHAFFDRYKLYLRQDGFALKAIENIELVCEKILSHCANPKTDSPKEQRRGLVVGDVQSGKTANYLGLMNMAYDYGYKIVILLAGLTDSLRIQTQKRTDKGVIGAKSDTIGNTIEYCGVGVYNEDHYVVPFTNQENDFARFIQRNLNASISDIRKPVVLVVKKNKKILESVIERLQSALKGFDSKSILIIDDEADNASISTARPGKDPTTINRCIRGIFNKFPIASYVGFTATPFANIFINPIDEDDENLDLFPSDFIIQLNAPDAYFGGRKVFPSNDVEHARHVRLLDEEEELFLPVVHAIDDDFIGLPHSMKEAIHSFLINNVVRTLRGHQCKHRSMMINITRYNNMQTRIWDKVSDYVEKLKHIIEQDSWKTTEDFIENAEMRDLYDLFCYSDFYAPIREGDEGEGYDPVSWEEIKDGLNFEIQQFMVVIVNSRNGKMSQVNADGKSVRFDYEKYDDTGARVIAIGGMVLSRGLTLEGLMVSYYSRNAGAYDTLLQMCRWFGYRPKYEDLCRVYLSQINVDRFDAVLDAVADLKQQFAEMDRQGKTPKDFGLMVKQSPDTLETTLLITSRNKSYHTETMEYHLNYGGVYADTSKMYRAAEKNNANIRLFETFYSKLSDKFGWDEEHGRFWASGVHQFDIADFIRDLKIPFINKKFDTEGLSEYIESSDIFPWWDVVIATGNVKEETAFFMGDEHLPMPQRSFHLGNDEYIRIGGTNNRVLEPGIFNTGLWLTEERRQEILRRKTENANGQKSDEITAIDYLCERERPILVIYPIDLKTVPSKREIDTAACGQAELEAKKKAVKEALGQNVPLLAFAIGFPKKESDVIVTYRINKVKYLELTRDLEVTDEEEGEDIDD